MDEETQEIGQSDIGLTIMHMNIRSLRKHKEVEVLMERAQPDVMILTEANITDFEVPLLDMDNYNIIGKLRKNRRGEG